MEDDAPTEQSNQQQELKARHKKKKKSTDSRQKKRTKKKAEQGNQQQQPSGDNATEETSKSPLPEEPSCLSQQSIRELFSDATSDSTSLVIDRNDLPMTRTFNLGQNVPNVVENVVSGDFFRVNSFGSRQNYHKLPSFSALRRASESGLHKGDERRHLLLREVGLALILMGQGILTGLLWMHAFDLTLGSNDSLVCAYGAMVDRYRQLFFLLFNFSLLGLMKLLGDAQQVDPNESQEIFDRNVISKRLFKLSIVLMLVALLSLLIASPSTVRLRRAYARDSDWCTTVGPNLTRDRHSFAIIRNVAVCNTLLASLTWFLIALQPLLGTASQGSLMRQRREAQTKCITLEQRVDQLHGHQLELLSVEQLKELIKLHQRAIEATEHMLVSRLRSQA